MQRKIKNSGFSLLELLITIAILAILASVSFGYFRNFAKNVELEEMGNKIASDLKSARSKSINGEDNLKWGIRFINGATDYFELFSTPTDYSSPSKTIKETSYFSVGINFTSPGEGSNTDIIFDKIYGSTTPATITIELEGNTKTINVNSSGNVY